MSMNAECGSYGEVLETLKAMYSKEWRETLNQFVVELNTPEKKIAILPLIEQYKSELILDATINGIALNRIQ